MAGLVQYQITNAQTLKAHSQEIVNKTAVRLGFDSARKSITVRIRFRKGASHQSWNSGKLTEAQQLATWLVKGFRAGRARTKIRARPVFDQYLQFHGSEIRNRCVQVFNSYKGRSIKDRALIAGEEIKRDFQRRIYQGSFYLAPNMGHYALKKMRLYGDTPLVATKALFKDLEVVIE